MCLDRCSTGLRGKFEQTCYTDCPSDSLRTFDWGQTGTSQEYSDYDPLSATQCSDSNNHLLFKKDGNALSVPGPSGLNELPTEYTITAWLRPIESFVSYGRDAYIANFFNVIKIYATIANKIRVKIGDSGVEIQPTYNSANDGLDSTTWNFISVSVKTTKSATNAQLNIVLSLAPGRDATLVKAGEGTINMPTFNNFINTIFIGAQNETATNSFRGYLKELRMFKKYHSFDQLTEDKLKIYKKYSYDDPNLIVHWKLDEAYNSSSTYYKIHDYTSSRNSLAVYLSTTPNHPSFVQDATKALNLCYYHDVADCLTLDKSDGKLSKYVYGGWRLTHSPALNIASSTITISNGDEIHYSPHINCTSPEAKLYRKYNKWREHQYAPEPTDDLIDGTHYYLCYYSVTLNAIFPLAQVYNAYIIDKISPVELSSFRTAGVVEAFNFEGGDQSFGDTILFSSDCDEPSSTDFRITRTALGVYPSVTIINMHEQQQMYFCYRNNMQDPTDLSFESVRSLEYKIVERPQINTQNQYTLIMNYDTKPMIFDGPLSEGDYITLSWAGDPPAD